MLDHGWVTPTERREAELARQPNAEVQGLCGHPGRGFPVVYRSGRRREPGAQMVQVPDLPNRAEESRGESVGGRIIEYPIRVLARLPEAGAADGDNAEILRMRRLRRGCVTLRRCKNAQRGTARD